MLPADYGYLHSMSLHGALKMQDWKCQGFSAGLENAGVEISGKIWVEMQENVLCKTMWPVL